MKTKPEYFYQQSGVIPFRNDGSRIEILLISSRNQKRWIIPKGIIEPGLTPEASALREAYEEAGLQGEIAGAEIGSFRYEKWGGVLTVQVFPMKVTGELADWPESHFRVRAWMTIEEAREKIGFDELKPLFDIFQKAHRNSQ